MRFRLMATYRGVPYEAGVGPAGGDVVLFAACPPPEELGFEPATGHWRKQVIWAEVDMLWESRPVGIFRGEPCLVLDDLGDRLHIAYLGTDADRAARLGYWQVDRGVFELLAPREEVTSLTEERLDRPLRFAPQPAADLAVAPRPTYPYGAPGWPSPPPPHLDFPHGQGGAAASAAHEPLSPPLPIEPRPPEPPRGTPPTGQDRRRASDSGGGRSARRQRVTTRDVFCQLADLAAIPRGAYALEAEVDGAMCLLASRDGFEVFVAVDGARHEVRTFAEEEAAYFYLFGVLAAEAIRSGSLLPSGAAAHSER